MVTMEYGKENKEVIILLHGGGLCWWNYREVAEALEKKYHIVLPILDGHAGSDKDFSSIEENEKEMIQYIDEVHNGSVALIGGVSLGGQILVEMLAKRRSICRYAMIESALILPMRFTNVLVKPMLAMSYGFISQPWKITKENMIAFLQSNSGYVVKKELETTRFNTQVK